MLAVLIIGTVLAWENIRLLNSNLSEARTSAKAAVEAANVARDSLIIENRPWLYFERRPLTRLLQNGDVTTTLATRNAGMTPALNVRGCIAVEIVTGTSPTFGLRPCVATEATVLRPGSEEVTVARAYVPNSKPPALLVPDGPTVLAVAKGASQAFVHGRFDYSDVFGVSHWAEFCEPIYRPISPLTPLELAPSIIACAKHNSMDGNTRTEDQSTERQPQ